MSLVLLLSNADQVVLLGDRRISIGPRPLSEEYNKVGIVNPGSMPFRLGFGVAGLAAVGDLNMRRIVLEQLGKSFRSTASQGHRPVEEFALALTKAFRESPRISTLPTMQKALTVMLAGYDYQEVPPRMSYFLVSNFQDFRSGIDGAPNSEFVVTPFRERRPLNGTPTAIQRIGMWPALPEDDTLAARRLLEERRPAKAIVGKGIRMIRGIADDPRSGGYVGKQVSWVVIPRDSNAHPCFGYDSYGVVNRIPIMTAVLDGCLIDGGFIGPTHDGGPMDVGHAPKAAPCPCGSGRKYRHCHGRLRRQRWRI